MEEVPTFKQACERFREFLVVFGQSPASLDVFEDYAWVDRVLYLCPDELASNNALAAAFYDAHIRELGVVLTAVATNSGRTLCTVWAPITKEEAEHRMVKGLKLSMHENMPEVTVANTPWETLREASRKNRYGYEIGSPGWLGEVLSRSALSIGVARFPSDRSRTATSAVHDQPSNSPRNLQSICRS